jgi:TRCF domain-containing protein
MDIRGAGNLLGEEQSGHIREVGIELYQHLLEEAVASARSGVSTLGEAPEEWTPQITIGMPVLIPETYVADLNVRLGLYRRIAALLDPAEMNAFAAELVDRFGPLPPEVDNLLELICDQAALPRRRDREGGGRPQGCRAELPPEPLRQSCGSGRLPAGASGHRKAPHRPEAGGDALLGNR